MTYAVIGSPKHPSVVFIPIIVMKIGNIVITEHKKYARTINVVIFSLLFAQTAMSGI